MKLGTFVNITAANDRGSLQITTAGIAASLTGSVPAGTFTLPGRPDRITA